MESKAYNTTKDLFNMLNQKPKTNDLNELMLKYVLDLNSTNKSNIPKKATDNNNNNLLNNSNNFNTHNKSNFQQDYPNSTLQTFNSNNNSTNLPMKNLGTNDIDFFCSKNSQENWANFDTFFSAETLNDNVVIQNSNDSFFEVWHKFFLTLKQLYDSVYQLFKSQNEINSQVFNHTKIQEFLENFDETYVVFRRVLSSSNKYVNKKQSHLDNNLKHEIEKSYSNINKIVNRVERINNYQNMESQSHALTDTNNLCSFCLQKFDLSHKQILFSSKNYHLSCINLWLNMVDDSSLPDLKLNLKTKEYE